MTVEMAGSLLGGCSDSFPVIWGRALEGDRLHEAEAGSGEMTFFSFFFPNLVNGALMHLFQALGTTTG